jgi:glutathione reductase (NADPH)
MKFDFDYFVIGGGSGGVRSARIASELGAKVGICEEYRYGGTCVIRGCVPKKLMVYASHFYDVFEDSKGFGWEVGNSSFSWERLIHGKNKEISRLSSIYEKNLLASNVKIFKGHASFIDPHTIEINGEIKKKITAKYILIATGGSPIKPQMPGAEYAITSNEVFNLEKQPKQIAIIGAGYIGLEFSCIFHGLGTKVTIVHRGTDVLNENFDMGLRKNIKDELTQKGIKLEFTCGLKGIEKNSDGRYSITYSDGRESLKNICQIMFATGRAPNTNNLNLEKIGVKKTKIGAVEIDAFGKSSIDSIYAVGDVSSRVALTPVAIREGNAVAQTLFGKHPVQMDLSQFPSAVFTQPPMGTVGLTEKMALERFKEIDIYEEHFKPLKNALSGRKEKVFMKLVVDAKSQKIVGAHMIGDDAPEVIQAVAIAVKMGATKQDFDATIAIHPTVTEEFVTMKKALRKTL